MAKLIGILLCSFYLFCQLNDGKIFDSGLMMESRAENAPKELDQLSYIIGQWNVEFEYYLNDTTVLNSAGKSVISYMNRGHAIMERIYINNFDGKNNEWNSISFLGYNTIVKNWSIGIANSYTESIEVLDGDFVDGKLLLKNAVRRRGGSTLNYFMYTIRKIDNQHFDILMSESIDHQKKWNPLYRIKYSKNNSDPFLVSNSTYGTYTKNLPDEARQFDFLIGTYDAPQEFRRPNANSIKFPTITTGVFALNGHAILEFNWYDVDPNLPNAATSIIRIYNRAMRRWESLFMSNRGNGNLFFGGVRENDKIILTLFEHNTSDPIISRFVFHSIEKDSYKWYGEISSDRANTFTKNWIIEMTRREEAIVN